MIQATVTGNVGKAPELRTAQSGKQVASFSVASTAKKDGPTTWVDVVCFDEQADVVSQRLKKGDRVVVSGRLALETYEKRDGSQGSSLRMLADEVGHSLRWPKRETVGAAAAASGDASDDGEVPF